MKRVFNLMGWLIILALMLPAAALAQEATPEATPLPAAYQLQGIRHEYQLWNNCGPATLTMGLTYYGYADNQGRAASWLKPNTEDKNVSPWQMAEFVNTQVPGTVFAMVRTGGTLERIKTLIANNFPVIIEEGYDPPEDPQGWMGHYLLISGYDDNQQSFITQDSFLGPNRVYSYDHIREFWQHFNYTYIVLYTTDREADLTTLLGEDADAQLNTINALELAQQEATANPEDPFAWFNMGTNFVVLEMWEQAEAAYDLARSVGGGLPWRMLWYQFGPLEAYYQVGRYNDMLVLVQANLNDGGGQYVEETYYYGGLAREGLGEIDRALLNYNSAIQFNPNFTPAIEARDRLAANG